MIERVRISSSQDGVLDEMDLYLVPQDGVNQYQIRDIDGLGPVAATISTSNSTFGDGGAIQGARSGMRSITFRFGLNPDYTTNQSVQSLRTRLMKLMGPAQQIVMIFYSDDHLPVRIDGTVETNEPGIFTDDPEIVVSVLCPNPYFRDINFQTVTAKPEDDYWAEIEYTGTAQSGFTAVLTLPQNAPLGVVIAFSSRSFTGPLNPYISVRYPLLAGDVVTINTTRGQRSITYRRGSGFPVTITGSMTDESSWVQLVPSSLDVEVNWLIAQINGTDPVVNITNAAYTFAARYRGL